MKPESKPAQSFYRWVDHEGRLHVVSSLDAVPLSERGKLEQVTLNAAEPSLMEPAGWRPDWSSFALGFGAALLVTLLLRLLPGSWKRATGIVLALAAIVLLTGGYLAAVRRSTGVEGASALAAPSALIQDAKDAVQKMNERQLLREKQLQEIEQEGRK
jgi:hypothetical protein